MVSTATAAHLPLSARSRRRRRDPGEQSRRGRRRRGARAAASPAPIGLGSGSETSLTRAGRASKLGIDGAMPASRRFLLGARLHASAVQRPLGAIERAAPHPVGHGRRTKDSLQGPAVPRTGDRARHALDRVLGERARPNRLKNSVRPLGLKHTPASSEALRTLTASSNAWPRCVIPIRRLTFSIPGASGCVSTIRRGGVVLTRDQPAARRDREVVGRVAARSPELDS